ncbi:MAG: glycoside hydrolase family 65 protein [Chloroflexi bacterium]|nr:glycoside hydrolase family 65 protein [Chloroflexota bacterium]
MPTPLSPGTVRALLPARLPPYLSNGVIGIRFASLPHLPGTTTVSGFAGISPDDGVEGLGRAPYILAADVSLNGVWASTAPEWVGLIDQQYDFAVGELVTRWTFRSSGTTATVETTVFCSRSVPGLAALDVTVTVDGAADIELSAGLDASGVPGFEDDHPQPQDQGPNEDVDGRLRWHSGGNLATLGLAYTTAFAGDAGAERSTATRDDRGRFSTTYRVRARRDRRYRLSLLSAVVPDLSHARPDEEAGRIAALGAKLTLDGLRRDNRRQWDELWTGRIVLDGADRRWQAITDASVFYLLSSTHSASLASTSLFGLAYWPTYHYYHGHVMWDIETFTLPPLLLLAPHAAHALLDYRFRNLASAHHNAALHGWRGAMYPWESCPQHGEEATPGARPYTEDHVSADIALAFAGYVNATGDRDYARRIAWPVLRSVAEFIVSRVVRTRRGYEILGTVGPREVYTSVDNNAYTNMSAALALEAAVDCAAMIDEPAPDLWGQIAARLVLPRDRRRGAIINHDRARLSEPQGGVPEGAAGLFPLGYQTDPETELATYRYAALEQAPLYVGAPMLSALLPVYAARAGEPALAGRLLERGYGDFINEPFLEPDEYPRSRDDRPRASPMFANLSGYLTGLLYGFTGLRPSSGEPETWPARPPTMPEGWRGIEVERVWVRGRPYSLVARSGTPNASLAASE